jgi:hypothetical protein
VWYGQLAVPSHHPHVCQTERPRWGHLLGRNGRFPCVQSLVCAPERGWSICHIREKVGTSTVPTWNGSMSSRLTLKDSSGVVWFDESQRTESHLCCFPANRQLLAATTFLSVSDARVPYRWSESSSFVSVSGVLLSTAAATRAKFCLHRTTIIPLHHGQRPRRSRRPSKADDTNQYVGLEAQRGGTIV